MGTEADIVCGVNGTGACRALRFWEEVWGVGRGMSSKDPLEDLRPKPFLNIWLKGIETCKTTLSGNTEHTFNQLELGEAMDGRLSHSCRGGAASRYSGPDLSSRATDVLRHTMGESIQSEAEKEEVSGARTGLRILIDVCVDLRKDGIGGPPTNREGSMFRRGTPARLASLADARATAQAGREPRARQKGTWSLSGGIGSGTPYPLGGALDRLVTPFLGTLAHSTSRSLLLGLENTIVHEKDALGT